ncbi:MAG: alpha/beta hydrolase [Desulfomonile tiedjei]|nr:alpha/beta hydrolase [Desulfomonile tiedjei]
MVDTILKVFFTLVAAGIVVIVVSYFWNWYYASPTSQDETHFIRTKDGWPLAIHRYRADKPTIGHPVVLCHGLSSNRYSFDLPSGPGLARYLSKSGWDVWVPELRGSGMSARPGLGYSDVPYAWGFEDHLREDVPAIVDFVLEKTGSPSLHWVGHSMGGMLIQAHLAAGGNPPVASAVAIGSPADFTKVKANDLKSLLKAKPLLQLIPLSPLGIVARLGIPLVPRVGLGFFNAANVEPEISRKTVALAAEPLASSKLWLDFSRFVEAEKFANELGEPYLTNLPSSKVPLLRIGGAKDMLAPPDSLIPDFAREESSAESRCTVLGKASGCEEDYGHVDLMVGLRAASEVFPLILQWLTDHDPVLSKTDG